MNNGVELDAVRSRIDGIVDRGAADVRLLAVLVFQRANASDVDAAIVDHVHPHCRRFLFGALLRHAAELSGGLFPAGAGERLATSSAERHEPSPDRSRT